MYIAIKLNDMKATDLRIGNLVIDHLGDEAQVSHFSFSVYDSIPSTMPSGIPLTEEWLIKFGFVLYGGADKFADRDDFWQIENDEHGGWYCDHLELSIKHVHQLQNLYFALTNEELTIK